ncbi:MAG TPA: LuxR C-terminal-related transcriptional regulator [Sideroxyarcus sp.]|nr:LuxR C-terminal-related transcriptional regulator [Sideroxyarcus sp.]
MDHQLPMNTRTQPALYDVDTLQTISSWIFRLQELSTTTELADFPRVVMESLKPLIPHQSAFWGGGRLSTNAAILHYVYLVDLDVAALTAWEKCKEQVDDVVRMLVEHQGTAITFSDKVPLDHPFYSHLYHPFGINDVLSIYQFDAQLGIYHVTSLYRNDGSIFTEAERGIFQAVARHLTSALRTCQIAHIKRLNESPLINLVAKAIVDTEGVIHFAEDRLIDSLRTEWPAWEGPWLPHQAWSDLSKKKAHRFTGKHIVLSLEGHETLRLLCARPKLAIDELSCREREVAKLFASGLSHKEIAQHLTVSPSTIRNQINAIYEKLGLSDKGALSAYLSQF